ncbi:MAG: hypothetical protein WCG21_06360 [Eubacteriales bacterium]
MVKEFLVKARSGQPVYISTVNEAFDNLKDTEMQVVQIVVTTMDSSSSKKLFILKLPILESLDREALDFVKSYIWAEIYNILSSLGGKSVTVYADSACTVLMHIAAELNEVFCIGLRRADRRGYGRAINVIDRMHSTLFPGEPDFCFIVKDVKELAVIENTKDQPEQHPEIFAEVTRNLETKIICGIDVGGTDIKIVLVRNGMIACCKEYDWFPAGFTESSQLVDPICLIIRLIRAKISLDSGTDSTNESNRLNAKIQKALDKTASDDLIKETVSEAEVFLNGRFVEIDSIGLCFPDVVVKDKIVGGEVYKTRGIRDNPGIDYEKDFLKLTNLDARLHELIKKDGRVNIANDGPMAAFTAAVELYASCEPDKVNKGVFAHTLGTELGTGWVDGSGRIPDIPLEVYNFIIDLGSFVEKEYQPDDLRSINNFNTGLSGTLQKYCSQSGVFRLAMKYFPDARPDLYRELFEKGFVVEKEVNGITGLFVPTEPVDMRKPFLEHMMSLPDREKDAVNSRIWQDIGTFLAITWIETNKILNPCTDVRVLFGRLVKNKTCFELIREGARFLKDDIILDVADAGMANTRLMQQLENDPHYSVAQFAQAVGAVYYGNLRK